jgi:hypothetical protein
VREKISIENDVKLLLVEVMLDQKGEKIASFQPFLRTQNFNLVSGLTFPEQALGDWDDVQAKMFALIDDLKTQHGISDLQIYFLVDPPLFDQAFHLIARAKNELKLGEQFVVLLKHRGRVRFATSTMRTAWTSYAKALRPQKPCDNLGSWQG